MFFPFSLSRCLVTELLKRTGAALVPNDDYDGKVPKYPRYLRIADIYKQLIIGRETTTILRAAVLCMFIYTRQLVNVPLLLRYCLNVLLMNK
ncbi:hypothetical protein B0T17DRAFT_515308 [Bombardia bombarda]|uniref:Uncharacterized protein n=1 Tax=Bombardia bombarda TaxID=252184 RepID=A0AA40CDS7_9PEZI|nr:hypothetical protein B0T17DRAFT_515308 [Bombardia bombarda]